MNLIDLVEKHKLMRRLSLVWAMFLITWVVIQVFADLTLITGSVATALSIVVGILATVVGFYTHTRSKQDAETDS